MPTLKDMEERRQHIRVLYFLFVLFFFSSFVGFSFAEETTTPSSFSIVILSDLHIGAGGPSPYNGEVCNSTRYLQQAITEINSKVQEYGIRWVFITGDITNSAEPTQYEKAAELLSTLSVPFFPLMGNHDTWPYNSQMETLQPIGDRLFASYFNHSFTQDNIDNINKTLEGEELVLSLFYSGLNETWNPQMNVVSQFQNYQLKVTISSNSSNNSNSRTLVFLCLDWNTRAAAILWDKNKGALPGGDLFDFPGGTLPWLAERVQELSQEFKGTDLEDLQVITLQHQPYMTPWFIPRWEFTFDDEQEKQIQDTLSKALPIDNYWGVIAGHVHRWWNSTAFELPLEWRHFWQWETNACKGQWNNALIHSGFTIARFEDLRLADLIAVQPPPSP